MQHEWKFGNQKGRSSDLNKRIVRALDGRHLTASQIARALRHDVTAVKRSIDYLRCRSRVVIVAKLEVGERVERVYGLPVIRQSRPASIHFAGYREIGRGLANW